MWINPKDIDHWVPLGNGEAVPVRKGQSDDDAKKAFIAEKEAKRSKEHQQGKDRKSTASKENTSSIREQVEAHKGEFKDRKAVAKITGEAATDFKTAVMHLKRELEKNGGVVTRKGFGDIQVSSRLLDAKKYLDGQDDITAIAAIPAVLKNGVEVGKHDNHKSRGYSTITFAAKIEIGGKTAIMGVVVKQTTKNFYDVHRVFTID